MPLSGAHRKRVDRGPGRSGHHRAEPLRRRGRVALSGYQRHDANPLLHAGCGNMTALIIDVAEDVTAKLPQLKACGVKTIFGYLSSINPNGGKCFTPPRVRAIAAAGMRVGLVHEGWGGVG